MSAWTAGDSKRLWHSLTKPLSIKYTEAEQQLDMQLNYLNATDFEVRGVGQLAASPYGIGGGAQGQLSGCTRWTKAGSCLCS
jgi:hypothetical protein